MNKQKSVFLIGLRRSGSSWIGKVFDSHPDVHYRFEPFQPGAALHPVYEALNAVNPLKMSYQDILDGLIESLPMLESKCPWLDRYPLPLPQKDSREYLVIKTVLMSRWTKLLSGVGKTIGIIRDPYSQITSQLQTIEELRLSCPHCLAKAWLKDSDAINEYAGAVVKFEDVANDPQKLFMEMFEYADITFDKRVQSYIDHTSVKALSGGVPDRFGVCQDKGVPLNRFKQMPETGIDMIHDVIKDTQWNEVYPRHG